MNLKGENMTVERYRLILAHEYIDEKNVVHKLEEPICTDYSIVSGESSPPKSVIINEMLERLRRFILDSMKQEAENV